MAILASPKAPAENGGSAATTAAVQPNPFTRASKRMTEPLPTLTRALGASAIELPQIDVPPNGYLRDLVLDVVISGTTGATYNADAPWNVIQQLQLTDVNGQALVQLSGYDLYLSQLLGGYAFHGDPADYPGYSTSGTGARFQIRVPIEIVQRNALGSLQNMNAAMTYKLKVTLAPAAVVYATNPSGATVTINGVCNTWMNPLAVDLNGRPNTTTPPQLGITQNWSEYVAPVTNGANTIRMTRVGNIIRNLVFVFRDNSGVRTDSGIPSELALLLDGVQWKRNSFAYEQQRIFEMYGYDSTQRPAGVWVLPFTDDFDGTPGDEIGDYYLQTTGATRLEIQGIFTAAGSLTIITNDLLSFSATAGAGQTLGA